MIGWLGTPLARIIEAIVGIALLFIGMEQVNAYGLLAMMTGLIATVVAAAPPFLMPVPVVHAESRPPSPHSGRSHGTAR